MWFVTDQIRGDGNSRSWQWSPEFPLVDLGISTASFYKHYRWQWPSGVRSMRIGCTHGSEVPLVLVSLYLEMLDSDLKISCSVLTQQAPTQRSNNVHWINDPWWKLLQGLVAWDNWSLHCWFSRKSPICFKETYLYDVYHKGDITLVTLGSVLACFFCAKEELFFIVKEGLSHTWWWG
jgi:hypothetical protein